jgi:hypothetical protein
MHVVSNQITVAQSDCRSDAVAVVQDRRLIGDVAGSSAGSGQPKMPRVLVAVSHDSFTPFVPHHTPNNGESDGL